MRRRRRTALPPAFAVLLGAALGLFAGWSAWGSMQAPTALDSHSWHVVSPGLNEGLSTPDLGRGAHIVDGALTITPHVFHRADTLVSQVGPVSSGELRVASDSGPVDLRVGTQALRLGPGSSRFELVDGVIWLEGGGERVAAGQAEPGDIELTTGGGRARIEAVQLSGPSGQALMEEEYSASTPPVLPMVVGALLGAVAGALGLSGVWAVLPFGLALISPQLWLEWVERLYLTTTPAHDLARLAVLASSVPLLLAGLSRLVDRLPRRSAARPVWVGLALVATLAASIREPWWALLGVPVLLLEPLLLRRAEVSPRTLAGDLPGLLAVALLGWGWGLLVLCLWRLLRLVAEGHAERHPRPAVDHLLLHLVVGLGSIELGLRSTSLRVAWDWGELSLESKGEQGWRTPAAGWSDSCGEGPTLVFAGGSSTGGAYQFADDEEAFFPALTHHILCEEGLSLTTLNHGFGDRDTFTISRTITQLSEGADLLVLYVGVNDVLTRNHQLTRKQREARREARSASARGLAGLARRSRLVTGLSLALRPVPDDLTENPPNVPLADAEENLRLVAAAGTPVVLVTEYISPDMQHALLPYQDLCRRLDGELDALTCLDAWPSLGPELLVDRNHLSREGNRVLAQELARTLGPRLR